MVKREENKESLREEEKIKDNVKKKQNKQIFIAILLMAFITITLLLVPYVIKNYIYKFTYLKLDFSHYKLGKIDFYSTKIPLLDLNNKVTSFYTMDFRNDPRKLKSIPVNLSLGDNKLDFVIGKKLYISTPPDLKQCEFNVVAVANLASFLRGMAKFDVKGASSDENHAKEYNLTYANCANHPNNTVIFIKNGDKTKIEKTSKNCYELTYANCDILSVTEKFDLVILEAYMEPLEKK